MAGLSQLGNSLYRGDVSYNIVGRRKAWYLVSAILIILSIATLGVRGLNLGIEFKGGAEFSVPLTVANDVSVCRLVKLCLPQARHRQPSQSLVATQFEFKLQHFPRRHLTH